MDIYQNAQEKIIQLLQLKNLEQLPLKEFDKIMEEIPTGLGHIIINRNRLVIIYSKLRQGLYTLFSSDEEVADFIIKNVDIAFETAIEQHSQGVYILNIASVKDFEVFDNCIPDKEILESQLRIFIPIIQKFMVEMLLKP